MRTLIKSGPGLGDVIVAGTLADAVYRSGTQDEIMLWCNQRYFSLYEKSPFVLVADPYRGTQYDRFVNLSLTSKDEDGIKCGAYIDCNETWWGYESHVYVPKLFLKKMNMSSIVPSPRIWTNVTPKTNDRFTIIFNNESKEHTKVISDEKEADIIIRILTHYKNSKIVVMKCGFPNIVTSKNKFSNSRIEIFDGSLDEMVALMMGADMYVGIDSGPTHLAAALKLKSVCIYSSTDWRTWCPPGSHVRPHRVNYKFCAGCVRQKVENPKCVEKIRCVDLLNINMLMSDIIYLGEGL